MFQINMIGTNYIEKNDFNIIRPLGSGDYLFLLFTTPVYLSTQLPIDLSLEHIDARFLLPPQTCILFTPDSPQFYCHPQDGFTNDWIHFNINSSNSNNDCTNEDDFSLLQKLDIPINKPFQINQIMVIRELMKKLELEYLTKEIFFEESIHVKLIDFFIEIARLRQLYSEHMIDPYKAQLLVAFRELRTNMLQNYNQPWTIEILAEQVNLSRSRFSVLYKEFFSLGAKEELIKERMRHASYFLLNTRMSITDIAIKVGYPNLYHFSKQFKKIHHLSPEAFRR